MLLGSTVLEVALGLTFLYFLLAIICSTVNEWVAGILKLRAKTLRKGIANLLEDPEMTGLARAFFAHPAVKGLSKKGGTPSYISAQVAGNVLMDLVMTAPGERPQSLLDVYQNVRAKLATLSESNSGLAKTIDMLLVQARVDPEAIQEAAAAVRQLEETRKHLLDFVQAVNASDIATLQPLTNSLATLQNLEVQLQQAEANASAALFQAQRNVELYFDQSMDRVSGWYKRQAQVIIIVIAVMATALLNADTISIAKRLAVDPVLRESVANIVEAQVLQTMDDTKSASLATVTDPAEGVSAEASYTFTATRALLYDSGFPIGWDQVSDEGGEPDWDQIPRDPESWFYKVLGLLITAIAASLGAPFWFEMLNKLVSMRMSGKKPAEVSSGFNGGQTSLPGARIAYQSSTAPLPIPATNSRVPEDELAALASDAVDYVGRLKNSQTLTVPERDVAVAWMLVETTNRGIAASPADIIQAIDEAIRKSA